MFDGSVPWSLGVGGGERFWRALGAPKRFWPGGFVVIDGVFVVAVGGIAEEGGEWPRGGGGRGADAQLDGRLEFFGARRVVGCALADAGLDGFLKACLGRGGGCWYTGRARGGMWTEVLNAPCETEKGLRGSEGCAQSIGSQGRGFEHSQSCAWWTALSRCFTRSSRARPDMALCSARVEPGIGLQRQDHRDFGTRVLMKILQSAFEGPESHQCRTTGLKRVPQEETYAWTCWSNALQKARHDTGSKGWCCPHLEQW